MLLVGGGTALGQGALVVAAPVLARLYDPGAFGLYSVYAAVLAVLVTVASLRFDFAIPIASDPIEAVYLFVLSVVLALGSCVILGLVVLLWGAQLSAALGAESLTPYVWLLPIGLFVLSVAQALSGWATFHRSFSALGRWRTMQGLAQAVGQVALGLIQAGPVGLIVGDMAGRTFGMQKLLRSLIATARSTRLSRATLGRYARERWGFARVMSAASFINALTNQMPFLIIPAAFGLDSSGQFFLAYRMLVLPSSLVSAAFTQVFFGEASFRRDDSQRLHDLAHDGAVSLLAFSIPTYAIIAVGGGALFALVFGPQWTEAGLYVQILAPSLILWSVTHPMSSLLLIGRRERESLAFTMTELVLETGALGIGVVAGSLTLGVLLLSIVTILLSVGSLWRFLRVASVRLPELVRPAGRIVALTLPSVGLVLLAGRVAPVTVPLAMAVGWVVSLALMVRFSGELRTMLSGSHD